MDTGTLIQNVQQAASPTELIQAVQALAASSEAEAIPALIEVLGYNNPAAAITAMQGLVRWGETAVPLLIEKLDGYNYGARAYAIRALATLGDARALEVLVQAAETDFAPSVRRAATKGLGGIYRAAPQRIQTSLSQLVQDEDWSIRYAAVVSLEAIAQAVDHPNAEASLKHLAGQDAEPVVQARALLALQRLRQLIPSEL
ncbi:HEAT repeat domain-containing protein [Leptolyngbya sp. FACHB-261]|uniref:HEAT repeat domain-containing protein n=1 Tax=Leptolyngbya sp. FACHB-261 TaxID=2692806 RepID=UPI001686B1D3|nr:HEAT repeat domain-containing protein [Leptolyngbya sp. FACHB-261]MBD2104510.1 HEAT repeat domain-containing protein [Leptolyngbya sp. FACHB-261]